MGSVSGLGVGLSFLFGCTLLGLVGELYYLLWWKRRMSNREEIGDQYAQNQTLPYLFCWKTANSAKPQEDLQNSALTISVNSHEQEVDLEQGLGKDLVPKGLGEESVDCELMRLHNLGGPPRFLFTINEETKEDLESEKSRKGSRTRSLSDIMATLDSNSPLPSPLPSPQLYSFFHHYGLNPLFETPPSELDLNKLRSSPPPTFKFLRDAEEKLFKRLVREADRRRSTSSAVLLKKDGNCKDLGSKGNAEEKDGSFTRLVVGKSHERELRQQYLSHCHSTHSQVLPLASSPKTQIDLKFSLL